MSRQPSNNNSSSNNKGGDNKSASSSSAPFQSRSTTRSNNTTNNTNKAVTYYQPSVHQFTCRGAFHLQPDNASNNERASPPINNQEDLNNIIKDTFICNGIQSKLRHVNDYPLAPSKDVAIHWFEGSGNVGNNPNASVTGNGVGQHMGSGIMSTDDAAQQHKENTNKEESNAVMESVEVEPSSTFSSYGTTQVNILIIQEIPVQIPKHLQDVNSNNNSSSSASIVNDPFGGFGSIGEGRPGSGGMLNPFGSLFGDFFGSGSGIDPWSGQSFLDDDDEQQQQQEEVDVSDNRRRNPWMMGKGSTSRSVSSSTRMERDEEGKRVVKTIQTTTIINNGKKSTEVVTTERHVDDGGRVETKKVVTSDDDGIGGGSGEKKKQGDHPLNGLTPREWIDQKRHAAGFTRPSFSPSSAPAVGATQEQVPSSPAEVAVIATDCLLGVSISDSVADDPDSALPSAKNNKSSTNKKNDSKSAGWRKTEYLFKLGRFIPPFMLVAKYYKDEEDEKRRRNEMQKEYNELTNKLKKNRWDKSSERIDTNNKDDDDDNKTKSKLDYEKEDNTKSSPISNDLSDVSSRTEYYMQRIYVQMIKNANMMSHLAINVVLKPDFPKKVQVQGTKIYNELEPTAERTGELMKKVWDMWIGYANGKSGSGGGWSSGSGGGDK